MAASQSPSLNIDPKYVGEIEASLGKLRVENTELRVTISDLEGKVKTTEAHLLSLQKQNEYLGKEANETAQAKGRARQLEFELEAKVNELKNSHEQSLQLRQQLFALQFDRLTFETNLKDNALLREHQKQLATALETLKSQFEEYVRIAGVNPDEAKHREHILGGLETKVREGDAKLIAKDNEISSMRREIDMLKSQMRTELEREKMLIQTNHMTRSQIAEEQTDINILKRKNESLRRENELLKKQYMDLKIQNEQVQSRTPNTRESGHFDVSPSKSVTIKRDQNAQKELQLKDLEIKELKQERTLLNKEVQALRDKLLNHVDAVSEKPSPKEQPQPSDITRMLGSYLERIESLTKENDRLNEEVKKAQLTTNQYQPKQTGDTRNPLLIVENALKVQELERQLQEKENENAELRKQLLEAHKKQELLMSNNGRLVDELTKLQDYIKNVESLNMSNLTQSYQQSNLFGGKFS